MLSIISALLMQSQIIFDCKPPFMIYDNARLSAILFLYPLDTSWKDTGVLNFCNEKYS